MPLRLKPRIVFCFCFCGLLGWSPVVAGDRPNVLLILVDDLKPAFGAYGEKWVRAPSFTSSP